MNRRTVSILLMATGAILILAVLFYLIDNLTTAQPIGLGQQILGVLGGLSAISGIIGLMKASILKRLSIITKRRLTKKKLMPRWAVDLHTK